MIAIEIPTGGLLVIPAIVPPGISTEIPHAMLPDFPQDIPTEVFPMNSCVHSFISFWNFSGGSREDFFQRMGLA